MKTPSAHHHIRPGFTLIELLVVITIITTLATISSTIGANAIKRARMLTDKLAVGNLAARRRRVEFLSVASELDVDERIAQRLLGAEAMTAI